MKKSRARISELGAAAVIAVLAIGAFGAHAVRAQEASSAEAREIRAPKPATFGDRLALAAEDRVGKGVVYDGAYHRIPYPMGDVPPDRGVCTDVVIRAYRTLGVDLQQLVHEDMRRAFSSYPKAWGLRRPDPNIDHRRVLNLEKFLARKGARLKPSDKAADYQPGDLVTYRLAGGLPHIAVVSSKTAPSGRPMIAHNIGAGPQVEDALFDYRIIARYRYRPEP